MAKILLIDENKSASMSLGLGLSSRGHSVEMATTVADAIVKGLRFRPDFIVTDWLLGSERDGFDVARTLRQYRPTSHSVLLTAFPTKELRSRAIEQRFSGMFEKPAELAKLEAAIEKAKTLRPVPIERPIGLIEYRGSDGSLVHVNERAKQILELDAHRPDAPRIDRLFSQRSNTFIAKSGDEWLPLSRPHAPERATAGLVLRGAEAQNPLLILLDQEDRDLKTSESMRWVQEAHSTKRPNVPTTNHVIVLDKDEEHRRLALEQLRPSGRRVHGAESEALALRMLAADPRVSIVLIDLESVSNSLPTLVSQVQEIRPSSTLIGMSATHCRDEFAKAGVQRSVVKPIVGPLFESVLASPK
jgi:CheY-like chemotaxis protein